MSQVIGLANKENPLVVFVVSCQTQEASNLGNCVGLDKSITSSPCELEIMLLGIMVSVLITESNKSRRKINTKTH